MSDHSPERVVRSFCERFPAQVIAMNHILSDRKGTGEAPRERLTRLMQEAHRMAGASHCMGFNFIGTEFMQLERDAEHLLKSEAAPDAIAMKRLSEKLLHIARFNRHVRVENSRLLRRGSDQEIVIADDVPPSSDKEIFAAQRILFADDDSSIRALMRATLVDLGIGQVQIARSGQEALDMARSFNPTILVSDWHMQPMDGLELLTHIRSGNTHLSTDTKIIFLTSEAGVKEVKQVIRRGVDHFLIKPFTREIIARAITKVALKGA